MTNIFVYGSARAGQFNHERFLDGQTRLCDDTTRTVAGSFRMYSLGPYPAVVLQINGGDVIGEAYSVTEDVLAYFDYVEESAGYARMEVKLDNPRIDAWMYVYVGSLPKYAIEVSSGDWVQYQNYRAMSNATTNS